MNRTQVLHCRYTTRTSTPHIWPKGNFTYSFCQRVTEIWYNSSTIGSLDETSKKGLIIRNLSGLTLKFRMRPTYKKMSYEQKKLKCINSSACSNASDYIFRTNKVYRTDKNEIRLYFLRGLYIQRRPLKLRIEIVRLTNNWIRGLVILHSGCQDITITILKKCLD